MQFLRFKPGQCIGPAFFFFFFVALKLRQGFLILAYSVAMLFLIGCAAPKYLDSFYIDKGVLQYYVHASNFSGKTFKSTVDFTFRNNVPDSGFCTCNFSVFGQIPRSQKTIVAGFIVNKVDTVHLQEADRLFFDGSNNLSRFSSKLLVAHFRQILQAKKVVFFLQSKSGIHLLTPEKEFYKKQLKAQAEIFSEN